MAAWMQKSKAAIAAILPAGEVTTEALKPCATFSPCAQADWCEKEKGKVQYQLAVAVHNDTVLPVAVLGVYAYQNERKNASAVNCKLQATTRDAARVLWIRAASLAVVHDGHSNVKYRLDRFLDVCIRHVCIRMRQ